MDPFVTSELLFKDISGTEPAFHALLGDLQPTGARTAAAGKQVSAERPYSNTRQENSHLAAFHLPTKQVPLSAAPFAKRSLEPALSNAGSTGSLPQLEATGELGNLFSTPTAAALPAKLGPALGGSNELQPDQSFTIPAFKCLTEDDLIMTDEMEYGGALAAAFGELGDPTKLGYLPSEDDLKLQLFDPSPPPAAPLAPPPHPTLLFMDPLLPSLSAPLPMMRASPFGLHPSLLLQQQLLLHHHQAAMLAATLQRPEVQQAQQQVKQEELGEFMADADNQTPPTRSSSLGSIKRRMDDMGLEDPGSPHAKRSNSLNSLLAWGAGSAAAATAPGDARGDMHRAASAPQNLSRFSIERQGQSLSPSPTPTPLRRAERAAPAKVSAAAASAAVAACMQHAQDGTPAFDLLDGGLSGAALTFKGVSKHKLTQRWEASLWLAGRQLYLGGFDRQEDAARAYDIAALACKGEGADTNFPATEYAQQMAEVEGLTREEVVAYVRRRSSAFSRGKSRFRGVSGHEGRWEARIGSYQGRKNVSFGIFDIEEEAARQYDRALILEKGRSAKTNFPIRDYLREVAEYEAYIISRCGSFGTAEAYELAQEYTLPPNRPTPLVEDPAKKRPALIYAEDLRVRLSRS